MATLSTILEELNMGQYLNDFVEAGFEDWDVLCDITESDLEVIAGLQRRIASERGVPHDRMIPVDVEPVPDRKRHPLEISPSAELDDGQTRPRKRRYVRHPKPDENAPKRVLSAYASFANDQRRERDYSRSSFADIAKHIGNLWKNLPADGKLHYQAQAATAKEDYAKQLALYKLTREYEQYQQYLADWKAEQAQKTGSNGRQRDKTSSGYAVADSDPSSPTTSLRLEDYQSTVLSSVDSSPLDQWLISAGPELSSTDHYANASPSAASNQTLMGGGLDPSGFSVAAGRSWQDVAWPMFLTSADVHDHGVAHQ